MPKEKRAARIAELRKKLDGMTPAVFAGLSSRERAEVASLTAELANLEGNDPRATVNEYRK